MVVNGNNVLGRYDTSRSKNSDSSSFEIGSSVREYTSWEQKPDKTCVKRVIVEVNGVETENKETPIDCEEAAKEQRVLKAFKRDLEEKLQKELTEHLRKMKKEREELARQFDRFGENGLKEFKFSF